MIRSAFVALVICLPIAAHARPSPYASVTHYDGDRISARQAQMGADVIRAMRIQRKAKRHRQRVPVARQIAAHEGMTLGGSRFAGARPYAWCGWFLGRLLGMPSRHLWLARNWASVGSRASPAPGVVVVWRHHVGIITGRRGNQWVIKSGNDGHRVRERPRSIAGAIAFRRV